MTTKLNALFLAGFMGVGVGGFISACGPTRTCNPTTCVGCCDSMGTCRSGLETSACGNQGGSCMACGLGLTCVSGSCFLPGSGAGTTGAGTAGGFAGGSSGGVAAGGSSGGGSAGGSVAGGLAGGTAGGATACNSTTCPGCCTTSGQCLSGQLSTACGNSGTLCTTCSATQTCAAAGLGGVCVSGSGGGGAGGGGAAGGAPGCTPQSCPGGCCSNGSCSTPMTSRCGLNGSMCISCPPGSTCVSGACTSCNGCVDASGACLSGLTSTACGNNGSFCIACSAGQGCMLGACTSAMPCTAQNCPSGCCRGTTCVQPAAQSNQECGTGGSTCAACSGLAVCNSAGGGCQTPDAGLPPIPDGGGFFQPCTVGTDCAPGDCCYNAIFLTVCATIGNPNLLNGTTCGRSQQMCGASCSAAMTCNAQGTCQ